MDINENQDAPEAEYIAPSVMNGTNFRPRRTLPDDTLPRYPGCDPLPPSATPATTPATPHQPQEYSYDVQQPNPSLYSLNSRFEEPRLSPSDFEYSWSNRTFSKPPQFLQQLREPLHSGWKSLDNEGGGACLFRSAADHIYLKDFKFLRFGYKTSPTLVSEITRNIGNLHPSVVNKEDLRKKHRENTQSLNPSNLKQVKDKGTPSPLPSTVSKNHQPKQHKMQQPTNLPDAQSPQDTISQHKKDKMTIEDTRTAKGGNTWKSKPGFQH